jgi:hypothetical protein
MLRNATPRGRLELEPTLDVDAVAFLDGAGEFLGS